MGTRFSELCKDSSLSILSKKLQISTEGTKHGQRILQELHLPVYNPKRVNTAYVGEAGWNDTLNEVNGTPATG